MSELQESVEKGQRDRAAVLRRFGFVPSSILRLKRGPLSRSLFNYAHERAKGRVQGADSIARVEHAKSDKARAKAEQRRAAGMFGGLTEYSGNNRETVSVMAAELVDFFVKFYSRPGATYLDPFAGHGVRMQTALLRGMNYLGMDASAAYVDYMTSVLSRYELSAGQRVEVRRGDSRDPSWIDDEAGDFCFTSPPYWDVEYYGPEPEQLGTGHTYTEFLHGMRDVLAAWAPKFKRGSYVCLNVNDLRREGRFVPYHSDLMRVLDEVGYELIDVWVVEGLVAGLPRAFAVSHLQQRIAPKAHEYVLIARAPGPKKRKRPTSTIESAPNVLVKGESIPAPVIVEHEGVKVVRDDMLDGGTKVRAIDGLVGSADEWVYPAPAQGYAQLALAIACERQDKRCTIFTAKRKEPHPLTVRAMEHGARIEFVSNGRLSNVRAKTRRYCDENGARFVEVGLLIDGMSEAITTSARGLRVRPLEVWVTAGTGTLATALHEAWPKAELHVVRVGMVPTLPDGAIVHDAPESFDQPARIIPPFPSALHYDAKAWRFVAEHARRDGRALFWNVGA